MKKKIHKITRQMPLNFTAGTYGHTRPHPENRDLTSEIVRVLGLFELPMSSRFCRDINIINHPWILRG